MKPNLLAIETSCDDTAAAVVNGTGIRSSIVYSQMVHNEYGGVVPELASRDHERRLVETVRGALAHADVQIQDLDAVAVTYGPGLAGSLLVGLSFAKGMAASLGLPLIGVNHIDGHIASVSADGKGPAGAFVCLVVSGGHTQIVSVESDRSRRVLGTTRDDAAGEAFDKVASMLGLPYPGGPRIDELARSGAPGFKRFPRARLGDLGFSFSGIKTAVLYYLNGFDETSRRDLLQRHLPDLCASFQSAMVDMLLEPLARALEQTGVRDVAIAGGVSANSGLRRAAGDLCDRRSLTLHLPALDYCVDNAAMIGLAGLQKWHAGALDSYSLGVAPDLKVTSF